jgi:hypothetical protein
MLFPCEGFLLLRPGMTLSPFILSLVTLSFVLLPVLAVPGLDPGISPGHPAFRPVALILRSSREAASRRRSSVLSGPSFETPLAAAPQDEAERDDRDHGP